MVYNVEPGVCVDNGGAWVAEPAPGGCDISKDALFNVDLSTVVVDNIVARDFPAGLAAAGNSEHERFVNSVGFLALILCTLIFIMWARGVAKSVKLNQPAQIHEDDRRYSSGGGLAAKDCNEKGKMESEDCNKNSRHGKSQVEND
jgi:hypothetical protein